MAAVRRNPCHSLATLVLACAFAVPAFAQSGDTAPATAAASQRDPAALAALDAMGNALRGLQAFKLTTDTTRDIVLDDGQKVQLLGEVEYRVQRPNKLFVDIRSDRKQRQLIFDGRQVTLYAPRLAVYAQAATQADTIAGLIENANTKYGIEFPLGDLFLYGTDKSSKDRIDAAMHVGGGMLDGEAIEQYAYRQDGIDWQLWLSKATNLPKRLVITSLDDDTRPAYTAQLHWDTKSPVDAASFAFRPPAGVNKIEIVPAVVVVADDGEQ